MEEAQEEGEVSEISRVWNLCNRVGNAMRRIVLTDGTGRWFDADTSREWKAKSKGREEDYRGEPEDSLFMTLNGTFALYQWRGGDESVTEIDNKVAVAFLIDNGFWSEITKLDLDPERDGLQM